MYVPKGKKSGSKWFDFTPAQVLVLGFAALILLGSFLLYLPISQAPGQQISFTDALFTSTSAVCVTGLVVVDTATQFSLFGELVVLLLIQAGGLGIMTLSGLMFLLVGRRIGLHERLMMQEALGSLSIAGVVRLTRAILVTSLGIELVGAILLAIRFSQTEGWQTSIYWGIFHAVSGFNNAGFDLTSASLRPYVQDPFMLLIIALLIILGGIGFFVLEDIWHHRKWERLSLHSRLVLKVTGVLIALGTLLILALEYNNPLTFGSLPVLHRVTNAIFAAVSPRTAGYESVATGSLLEVTLLVTMVLMFVGASPNSTGGGIKTTTFAAIALLMRASINGTDEVRVMGRRLAREIVDKSVVVAAIALGLVVTITGLLLLSESNTPNATFIRVMFEAVSAFGTVGLSTGLTPDLSTTGKLLISATMYLGRLGPLTMAVAVAQRHHQRDPLQYPEDRVIIG